MRIGSVRVLWPVGLNPLARNVCHTLLNVSNSDVRVHFIHWGYGATVARLTPDQKVGSSNLSGLIAMVYAGRYLIPANTASIMYVGKYVCMYVCMYVSMHVCMYECMYACMYVCMYACMYVCV